MSARQMNCFRHPLYLWLSYQSLSCTSNLSIY